MLFANTMMWQGDMLECEGEAEAACLYACFGKVGWEEVEEKVDVVAVKDG